MTFFINSFFLKDTRTFIHKLINYKFFLVNAVGRYNLFFLNFILGYDFILNFYFLDIFKLMKVYYKLRLFLFESISQKARGLVLLPYCFSNVLKNSNSLKNDYFFKNFLDIFYYFSKASFLYIFSKVSPGFYTNKNITLLYDSITNLNKLNVLKYSLVTNHLMSFYQNIFSFSLHDNKLFPDFVILFDNNVKSYLIKELEKMYIPFFYLCDIYCDSKLIKYFHYFMISSHDTYSSYFFNFILLSFFLFESYLVSFKQFVFVYNHSLLTLKNKKVNTSLFQNNIRSLLFYCFFFKFLKNNHNIILKKFTSFYFIFELFLFNFKNLHLK